MIIRIYTGDDGQSHIEDLDTPFGETGRVSVKQAIVRKSVAGRVFEGNAPFRHYDITIAGGMEMEVPDGTKRRLGPGDILFAEDLTGPGHIGRINADQDRVYILVPLEDQPPEGEDAYKKLLTGM